MSERLVRPPKGVKPNQVLRIVLGTLLVSAISVALGVSGCAQQASTPLADTLAGGSGIPYLFVASGACYGGGVTTSTATSTVAAYDLASGQLSHMVADYGVLSPGDNPVGIQDYDQDRLMVVVENAGGRRVDLVQKDGSGVSTYLVNTTALSAVVRALSISSDGSILVSKSSAIEKFGPSKSRILQGANPWVNAPAAPCATSTTLISSVIQYPNGKILYTHAAATPNNRFGLIASTGYSVAGDCLASTAGPATTALPTAAAVHPQGKTLIAYGSTTTASNYIYSYDVNTTANTIGGATAAYNNPAIINGPSAMAIDQSTGYVYVANAVSTFNTIEKFELSGSALTRVGIAPFISASAFTRCVSGIAIGRMSP